MFNYNMSEQMAKEILKTRKGADKNMDPQAYLVKVVNSDFGLKYPVQHVSCTL